MLTEEQKDDIREIVTDTKNQVLAAAIAAFIAVLGIIAAGIGGAEVAPDVPAPLPAGTGVDGGGEGDQVAQPDAGPGADAALIEQPDGIGGEVYLTSPVWDGSKRLNAGNYYPSGRFHGAWDIGLWRGTKVYTPLAGRVVGLNDGVPNQPVGVIRGSNSNWVLTCHKLSNGREATLYYQHGSPGVPVKRGQQVKAGQFVMRSGNTGNSTGDHLHLAAQWLRSGVKCSTMTQAQAKTQRYDYLNLGNTRIFAPSLVWTKFKPGAGAVTRTINAPGLAKIARNRGKSNRVVWVRKNLKTPNRTNTKWTASLTRYYAKYQRSLGYRGRAADGIPGCASLKVLGKRTPVKWSTKC